MSGIFTKERMSFNEGVSLHTYTFIWNVYLSYSWRIISFMIPVCCSSVCSSRTALIMTYIFKIILSSSCVSTNWSDLQAESPLRNYLIMYRRRGVFVVANGLHCGLGHICIFRHHLCCALLDLLFDHQWVGVQRVDCGVGFQE